MQAFLDVYFDGYRNREVTQGTHSESPLAEVTESSGLTTLLRRVSFNDRPYLTARLGDAEIHLHPDKLHSIVFVAEDGTLWGSVQSRDESVSRLVFDRDVKMSGDTSFGELKVLMGKLKCIRFSLDDKEEKT
jgi:hypothetical protein